MHERQIARALVCARAKALNYFELHVRCKIPLSKMAILQILCKKYYNSKNVSFEDIIFIEGNRNMIYRKFTVNKCDCMDNSYVGTGELLLVL